MSAFVVIVGLETAASMGNCRLSAFAALCDLAL